MKKLHKLSILIITVICANYGSTFAQEEQKAFKEGDKIISIGIGPGNETIYPTYGGGFGSGFGSYSTYNQRVTPSISFDYGLKGTRGIVSIGGFVSYSYYNLGGMGIGFLNNNPDSLYTNFKGFENKSHSITAGLRFALHYSTRKWDLYAGTLVGYHSYIVESRSGTIDYYKGNFTGGFPLPNATPVKSESLSIQGYNQNKFILSPYVGARYYVTKKVALNLEAGQYTGNVGLSFKF
jgi:hypothetical protein